MKKTLLLLSSLAICIQVGAQEPVAHTFKDTRIISTSSIETLPKRKLDVRIAHLFGDLAGDNGGFQTFYGLENVSDVAIGAEYGVNDQFTIGLYRTKGAGSMPDGTPGLRQLINAVIKHRLLRQQTEGGAPVSLTFLGLATMSAASKIDNPDAIRNFASFAHRFAYTTQLLIARKYSDAFSIQLTPSYTYRNITPFEDSNGLFSIGGAARAQLTKVLGLVVDVTFPLSDNRQSGSGFYPAIGIGLEIDTGGHLFQVNITNASALMETDYIPYTTSNWTDGEFRLGFTISRLFNL